MPTATEHYVADKLVVPKLALKRDNLLRVLSSDREALAHHDSLVELAARCGQRGLLDQLPYYASSGKARLQYLKIVIATDSSGRPSSATLLQQYKIKGLPTGIYRAIDFAGERTVIAPPHLRKSAAAQAAAFLLSRGAFLVHLTMSEADYNASREIGEPAEFRNQRISSATQQRPVTRSLELRDTYDATLALFGADTRRNFRRQTRRIEEAFGANFEASFDISEADFLELDRRSAYPVPVRIAEWRHRVGRHFPNSFFVALRARDGSLISAAGGRHQDDTTEVDWQINRSDMHGYSPVTAMRSHLIREAVARGSRFMRFDGGTMHTMSHAFVEETVCDLVFTHSFIPRSLITQRLPALLKADSLLGKVLKSKDLYWNEADKSPLSQTLPQG